MARAWGRRSRHSSTSTSTSTSTSAWPEYVPVAERRKQADKEVAALRKKGRTISPVRIDGTKITRTFWGKAWCDNLESYSDYANRLPRGRTYARNGSVVHLDVAAGTIEALVRGSEMYSVELGVKALARSRWSAVVDECAGQVTSLVELLEGKLSRGVMEIVTDKARGIFPSPGEITLKCSCPDWATMCKHVAAAMYGVGARLDDQPELLFRLRGVDPAQLIAKSMGRAAAKASRKAGKPLATGDLGSIFGIEIDAGAAIIAEATPKPKPRAKPKPKPRAKR